MRILGVESSCDETAAAVVEDGRRVLSNVVSSQIAVHRPFGGVVPELASRKHVEAILYVVEAALEEAECSMNDIDAIAVTRGPGLIGSLIVGISAAKAIAYALEKPLIDVNHLEGHIHAAFLDSDLPNAPFVCLVVSGGHTALYYSESLDQPPEFLGGTLDDAAGEAFDKVAKLLGLGYPGGVVIDQLSEQGNPTAIDFPRVYLGKDSLDFSFSGLKTAVVNFVRTHSPLTYRVEDLVASFQEAVVDVLVAKTVLAANMKGVKNVAVVGGVAANRRLRHKFEEKAIDNRWKLYVPPIHLCTDNAVMIAAAGYGVWKRKGFTRDILTLDAVSRWY
ncbi:MAG: tRNA (adenosine(37)-N6)-threonylcarbamoyltransferase complex transferase subunit TsaD [Deltaproteobacteria bacterium]|nr:tRNA (adenosine(37)-N6)-threonylcarbamoyltransferase complex transferase subunit TsaD [Deltaproteobacteria bacterium]MBW2068234.1 tRNA (adenosine(37)-N6)-threonylcarbamoyltransferase complex transferase subunit TsaD [Deltaproteobacteria bacterium]